jgi:hypothetical protein
MLLVCLLLALTATTVSAETWYIKADGSGDAPTIQAGIDFASVGDTVLVAAGYYAEPMLSTSQGSSMLVMKPGTALIGEGGMYGTTLDANGQGRVLFCDDIDSSCIISGFRITGGASNLGFGGGILCWGASPIIKLNWIVDNQARSGAGIAALSDASPTIRQNIIENNFIVGGDGGGVAGSGGGILCHLGGVAQIEENVILGNSADHVGGGIFIYVNSAATVVDNWIEGNTAANQGGGLQSNLANITVTQNVFVGNSATWGGGASLAESSIAHLLSNTFFGNISANGAGISVGSCIPTIERNIVAQNEGSGIRCNNPDPVLTCNDSWGNSGADFSGVSPSASCFSEDPLFCDPELDDFTLADCSPCVDGHGCGLVGAFGVGCGPTGSKGTTWGAIKSIYR